MAKTVGKIAGIVAGVALIATGVGAALGGTMVLTAFGGAIAASTIATVAGAVSLAAGFLAKPTVKASTAGTDRLRASLDPRTFRKIVFGRTAAAADVRYQEYTGTDQEYLNSIIVLASHALQSIDEIWFDDKLAWSAASGVSATYAGYLTVTAIAEGTTGNAFTIPGSSSWTAASSRLVGCAYVLLRYKLTGNSKKAESPFASGITSRITARVKGAKLYDPRQDSTAGGSGSQRADDQTTWVWSSDLVGRNAALQQLWYQLGWRIRNPATSAWKLAVGLGLPKARIDLASYIAAANLCDESVALAAGGTEPRYRADGIFSEGDDPSAVFETLLGSMNGVLRDNGGQLALEILHNDLGTPVVDLTAADVVGDFTWSQTPPIDQTFNVVRGRYVDPSDASLYQPVDYPDVSLPSPDGIERVAPFDLPMVQSPSQAQRLAKGYLQRAQYPGTFSAEFLASAWRCQVGSIVRLTFPALGFSNKLFRVLEHSIRFDGLCPMVLREEHAEIYAWDASEVPAVVAAAPITYNPLNDPLVAGIGDAAESAQWTNVTGKPAISERLWSMNYEDLAALNRDFTIVGGAIPTLVTTSDTGGKAVKFGDNSGNDRTDFYGKETIPFEPGALYEIDFDVEIGASAGSATLYLGVQALDNAGNNLASTAGTYCYLAAAAIVQVSNLGRARRKAWFRNAGPHPISGSTGDYISTPSNPATLPTGTAMFTPIGLLNYSGSSGQVTVYSIRVRKLSGALAAQDTAEWSAQVTGKKKPDDLATVGQNILPNPGGERGTTEPWVMSNYVGGSTLGLTSATFNSGASAFVLTKAQDNYYVAMTSAARPVTPGKSYVIGAWVKGGSSSASGLYVRVFAKAGFVENVTSSYFENPNYAVGIENVGVSSSWTFLQATWTCPAGIYWASVDILSYVNCPTTLYVDDVSMAEQLGTLSFADGSIIADKIASGALTTAKFATGIEPVGISSFVPGAKTTSAVFNTSDSKLYRWNGSAYVSTQAASDITGQLIDGQLAAIAASKVTGQLTNAQLEAIAAAKITGQIADTQIEAGAITTPKIAAGAITTAKLAAGAVTAGEIAAGAVTTAKLAAGAVTANEIAAGSVTTLKLAAGAVTANELAAGSVTAGKIAAAAISTTELAAGAVTTAKIAAGAVTANEIAASSVITSSAQIVDGIITNAKIGNLEVDSAKIANLTVGTTKLANNAATQVSSFFKTYFWSPGSSFTWVTINDGYDAASIGVATGPNSLQQVFIDVWVGVRRAGGSNDNVQFRMLRSDGTVLGQTYAMEVTNDKFVLSMAFLDPDPVDNSTFSYALQIYSNDAGTAVSEVFLKALLAKTG